MAVERGNTGVLSCLCCVHFTFASGELDNKIDAAYHISLEKAREIVFDSKSNNLQL